MHRLLAGPALAVDRGTRHRLGQPGRKHGGASDVERLVADLRDAAGDDVVDDAASRPLRSTSAEITSASSETGWVSDSAPPLLPRPEAVRMTSTITASAMRASCEC